MTFVYICTISSLNRYCNEHDENSLVYKKYSSGSFYAVFSRISEQSRNNLGTIQAQHIQANPGKISAQSQYNLGRILIESAKSGNSSNITSAESQNNRYFLSKQFFVRKLKVEFSSSIVLDSNAVAPKRTIEGKQTGTDMWYVQNMITNTNSRGRGVL